MDLMPFLIGLFNGAQPRPPRPAPKTGPGEKSVLTRNAYLERRARRVAAGTATPAEQRAEAIVQRRRNNWS